MRPALLIAALLAPVALAAQQPAASAAAPSPLKRTVLQTKPLGTLPGTDGISVLAELAAGASAPKHQHPGEEFAYVLEGTVTFAIDGAAPLALKAGDVLFVPANTPHVATNTGKSVVKLLSVYIIGAGKPLAVPVP